MSAFMAGAVAALKDQPVINAVIDGSDIVYRDSIDISVAVASPKVWRHNNVIKVRLMIAALAVLRCIHVYINDETRPTTN
jgi:pyruvate/2-oxoglutarate dehydrogenase complex dihydrolipoamide acyltransferase (E2) component